MSNIKDEIAKIKEASKRREYERDKKASLNIANNVIKEVHFYQKFVRQFITVLAWIWWNLGNPIFNIFFMPFIKWFIKFYINLWNKFTFYKDAFGNNIFSYKRGAAFVLSTAFALMLIPITLNLAFDTTVYFTTVQHKTVYLYKSSDNSFNDNDFSVAGCNIKPHRESFSCKDSDTVYYRVDSSLFNHIWAIFNKHNIFLPEFVAATVASDWNECKITEYGFRWAFITRNLQQFVKLLEAECKPISPNDLNGN
jgi:hypothetical protein